MKRLLGLVLIVLVTVLVVGGCDSLLGSDDVNGDDTTTEDNGDNGDDTTSDDDNGDDGNDTTTEVPDTVPEANEDAVTGEAYNAMIFSEEEENPTDNDGYGIDVALYSANPSDNDTYDYLSIASLFDSTDSVELEAGEYTYVADGEGNDNWAAPDTFDGFFLAANYAPGESTADYAASSLAEPSALSDNSDLITDGTITVSKDGDTYTIEWEMQTDGGETLSGSYEGTEGL